MPKLTFDISQKSICGGGKLVHVSHGHLYVRSFFASSETYLISTHRKMAQNLIAEIHFNREYMNLVASSIDRWVLVERWIRAKHPSVEALGFSIFFGGPAYRFAVGVPGKAKVWIVGATKNGSESEIMVLNQGRMF